MLLTVFREKNIKIIIRYLALKKIAYFWFPQGMIIFPGGERLKWNFRRGGGSILGADFGKSRGGEGLYEKSLPWGGMDIFWNHTIGSHTWRLKPGHE